MKPFIPALVLFFLACSISVNAQSLDGKPYTPGVDPDIDLYLSSWQHSMPRRIHGSLIVRDILTKGDPMHPTRKGAVLKYFNNFSHATLTAGSSTPVSKLDGEQEMIYILSGRGSIQTESGPSYDLYPGIAVLIPDGLEFTMTSSGDEALTMYLVNEPVPKGFRPNTELMIRDENTTPISSTDVHWAHIWKGLFFTGDGFGEIESTGIVTFDPMTIGHPHSHGAGVEEIWAAISGTSVAFIGKQIRMQPPGTAYVIPPDGNTPHSNINTNQKEAVRILYIARYKDHDVRP